MIRVSILTYNQYLEAIRIKYFLTRCRGVFTLSDGNNNDVRISSLSGRRDDLVFNYFSEFPFEANKIHTLRIRAKINTCSKSFRE